MKYRKSLKSLVFMLIALILVIGATSCAPKDDTDAPVADDAAADTTAADDTSEEPMEEMAEKTSITIIIPDNPIGFNGINTDTGYEQAMGELIMLSLSETDPNGNVYPELATEIPSIENGGVAFDEETWTMDVTWHLREDIYWQDGEQVTVDDVIFTWDIVARDAWIAAVDYVESVEKIDDFTLVVHFYEGYIFPSYTTMFGGEDFFVYPEHYCDSEQSFYEMDCDKNPLSNGPYILSEWIADDHITFVRNENYFDAPKPAIDQVIFQIVPEESVKKAMMVEGDGDLHYWPAENNSVVYQEAGNGTKWVKSPTERWVMRLIINQTGPGDFDTPHPFLADVRVRQAMRSAIDVDTIVNEVFLGFGEPVWQEFFRPPYNVCDIPKPVYDLEAAAALLTEAGWVDTDGDGVNECRGCENAEEGALMIMDFAIYAEYGETLELAQQLIAESWASIGLQTNLQIIEGAIMWAPAEDGGTELSGKFEVDMWDDGYPGTDPTDHIWTYYYSESEWNYGHWVNDEASALIDETYSLDEEYRTETFCALAEILDAEVPQILLWSALEQHGLSERLQGVLPSANDPVTWNIADWTVTP